MECTKKYIIDVSHLIPLLIMTVIIGGRQFYSKHLSYITILEAINNDVC